VILFFVTRREKRTLTPFFDSWGARLRTSVGFVYYERLTRLETLAGAATYVFTDLERLTPAGLRVTSQLADVLTETRGEACVLNHPRDVLLRYGFLCALHERGINPYRPYRALPVPAHVRYPVFLRSECDHRVLTPLLFSRAEVERELVRAYLRGHDLASLLVVEFEDIADEEGMFHRHISFVIGDTVIPGHLAYGSSWIVRGGPFLDGRRLAAQRASIVSREHQPFLLQVAHSAGVEYGRYDYAVVDGRIVIWELNTNPTILLHRDKHSAFALAEVQPVADRLIEAFERLAGDPGKHHPPVRVRLPRADLVARPRRWASVVARAPMRVAEPLMPPAHRQAILARAASRAAGSG
jgi:hypothetical protein